MPQWQRQLNILRARLRWAATPGLDEKVGTRFLLLLTGCYAGPALDEAAGRCLVRGDKVITHRSGTLARQFFQLRRVIDIRTDWRRLVGFRLFD